MTTTASTTRRNSLEKTEASGSCADHLLSIRFILPITVTLIVAAMAATTIGLMAANTDVAVNNVVDSLQDQVGDIVQNRVEAQLSNVLEVNEATSGELLRANYFPFVDNSSRLLPTYMALATVLDRNLNSFSAIDTHYFFAANGRVMAFSKFNATHNYYVEEYYPTGISWWLYKKYDVNSIVAAYNNPPDLFVPGYKGSERSYFVEMSRTVKKDYAWTPPYQLGPLLLFTGTMSMVDDAGVFRGVVGSDTYLSTLSTFLQSLNPTPHTKMFVVDTSNLLAMASSGDVIDEDGNRLAAKLSNDPIIAAGSRVVGDFNTVGSAVRRYKFKEQGATHLLEVQLFNRLRLQMYVAVVTPETEFLGSARYKTKITTVICVVIAVIGILIIAALCIKISANLYSLEKNLTAVSQLEFGDTGSEASLSASIDVENLAYSLDSSADTSGVTSPSSSRSHSVTSSTAGGFTELRRTNAAYLKLRLAVKAFKHYVPEHVVRKVISGGIQAVPGMSHTEVVVSFQDIANFTGLCESLPITYVVKLVSRTFEQMSKIIQDNDGTIDKYIGDAIMAYWHVGYESNDGEVLDAAGICTRALSSVMRSEECTTIGEGYELYLRSGVHFGGALIGNFGSTSRFNYTVVGDTVNTAARLEPMNKEIKTRAIASASVVNNLPKGSPLLAHMRDMGDVLLVGKQTPIGIYEVRARPMEFDVQDSWNAVLGDFRAGQLHAARDALMTQPLFAAAFGADDAIAEFEYMLEDMLQNPDLNATAGVRRQRHK